MDRIRCLHNDYELAACAFDPKYFDQAGQELLEEGVGAGRIRFPDARKHKRFAHVVAGFGGVTAKYSETHQSNFEFDRQHRVDAQEVQVIVAEEDFASTLENKLRMSNRALQLKLDKFEHTYF